MNNTIWMLSCPDCGELYGTSSSKQRCDNCKIIRRNKFNVKRKKLKLEDGSEVREIFEHYNWTCQVCKSPTPQELRGSPEWNAPEVDHKHPISKGGLHKKENVHLLCHACNSMKGDKTWMEFIDEFQALILSISISTKERSIMVERYREKIYDERERNEEPSFKCRHCGGSGKYNSDICYVCDTHGHFTLEIALKKLSWYEKDRSGLESRARNSKTENDYRWLKEQADVLIRLRSFYGLPPLLK